MKDIEFLTKERIVVSEKIHIITETASMHREVLNRLLSLPKFKELPLEEVPPATFKEALLTRPLFGKKLLLLDGRGFKLDPDITRSVLQSENPVILLSEDLGDTEEKITTRIEEFKPGPKNKKTLASFVKHRHDEVSDDDLEVLTQMAARGSWDTGQVLLRVEYLTLLRESNDLRPAGEVLVEERNSNAEVLDTIIDLAKGAEMADSWGLKMVSTLMIEKGYTPEVIPNILARSLLDVITTKLDPSRPDLPWALDRVKDKIATIRQGNLVELSTRILAPETSWRGQTFLRVHTLQRNQR